MSVDELHVHTADSALRAFLSAHEPMIVALSGRWGAGKTTYWGRFAARNAKILEEKFSRYAYVSLFGMSDLRDVRAAVFEQAVPLDQIAEGASPLSLRRNAAQLEVFAEKGAAQELGRRPWRVACRWLETRFRRTSSVFAALPKLRDLGPLIQSATFLSVRHHLVCIDDLERRGAGLRLRDVLGLATNLREQRKCSVLIILNTDGFLGEDDKAEYERLREKVFDLEVAFKPRPEETARLVFPEEDELNSMAREFATQLGITNIRILRRTRRLFESIAPTLVEMEGDLYRQLAHSGVLLTWSYYSRNEEVPAFDFLKELGYGQFLRASSDSPADPIQQGWIGLLQAYGYRNTDDFDQLLCSYIEEGSCDQARLKSVAAASSEALIEARHQGSFSNAWELFHGSFEDNEVDVINAFQIAIPAAARGITFTNMDATVGLMRELGHEPEAIEAVHVWIDAQRRCDPGRFRMDDFPSEREVRNPDLFRAMRQALEETRRRASLDEVVLSIAGRDSWGGDDVATMAAASTEEYYRLFKGLRGRQLHSAIRTCMGFGRLSNASEDHRVIAGRAKEALIRIASESRINEARVRRYGIALP